MVQMSQVLEYAHKTSSPQTRKIVEAMAHHAFRRCSAPFATLDQTVSALKGDVPGGSLQHVPTAVNRDSQDTPEVRV